MNKDLYFDIRCFLAHTPFAEDILRIELEFKKEDNVLLSNSIDTKNMEFYDDRLESRERYFRNTINHDILKKGFVYYIIDLKKFMIPLSDIKTEKEVVNMGRVSSRSNENNSIDEILKELEQANYPLTLSLF